MQRKAIRATVGATDVDIPIHTFLTNQFVFFEFGALTTKVAVRPVGTPTAGNLASWFNTEMIQDSGITLVNVVTNPGTSVVDQIATFRDSTGKTIQAVTATVVGGAFSNVTTINTRLANDFITGPASSVTGDILTFSSTTGKAAQDSGVLAANIVTTTATPGANTVATFTGTGKAIQPVSVTISGGALSSVTTINSRAVDSFITGPASAVSGHLLSFNGTSGVAALDSGIVGTSVVTMTTGLATNRVATFTGTGVAIQSTIVTISATGVVTNVLTLNGVDPATWVVGPGSAVANNVAWFSGTSGKLIADSGVPGVNIVLATSGPSSGHMVATWKGDGTKTIESTLVEITAAGVVTSVVSINGVVIEAHHSRHLPGGADTMYTTGQSWRHNYLPMYRGAADAQVMFPMHFRSSVCAGMTLTSTYANPAAAGTLIYSFDAGGSDMPLSTTYTADYLVEWNFVIDVADSTTGNLEFQPIWTGGTGVAIVTLCGAGAASAKYSSVTGTTISFTITGAAAGVFSVRCTLGITGASSGNDVSFSMRKTAGTGIVLDRGTCFVQQVSVNV